MEQKTHLLIAKVGWEFEFYSKYPRREIASRLSQLLGKSVRAFFRYHTPYKPTQDTMKLEPDFSGGVSMHELITGPLPYYEAVGVLIKVLKWIDENGWTDRNSAVQFNISFDKSDLARLPDLKTVNRLKYSLGFDEEYILSRFPERRDSVYSKSIKRIVAANNFIKPGPVVMPNTEMYKVINDKNSGVNFGKLRKNYLEIRYMGGKDYQKKYKEIRECMEYVLEYTFKTLQNNEVYSDKEIQEMTRLVKEIYEKSSSLNSLEKIRENYPDLIVLMDLKSDEEILKSFFPRIREVLYDLVIHNGITAGYINIDTQINKTQIKEVKTNKAYELIGYDIVDSEIRGYMETCRLINTEVNNSELNDCKLMGANTVKKSKIIDSEIDAGNEIEDSYIDVGTLPISGSIKGGVIRSGYITGIATISEETEIVGEMQDDKRKKGSKKRGEPIFVDRNYSDAKKAKEDKFPDAELKNREKK
jgi:hypothetical protein